MPRGVPSIGSRDWENTPGAEVLGELKVKGPAVEAYDDPDLQAQISVEEGPPPWENTSDGNSDARQFVKVPQEWVLYWINPKQLDASGWRGWQAVKASDPRVKVLVSSMVAPDNMIRRGGPDGDILTYMPRHWYEVKKKQYRDLVAVQTQSSVDRMESLKQEFAGGKYPNITLESAKHPRYTQADGRTFEP